MDEYGDVCFLVQLFCEVDVVVVVVGQDEVVDVGQWMFDFCEFVLQIVLVIGQVCVDQCDVFWEVDEIGGDDVVVDLVQVWGEFYGGFFLRDCDGYVMQLLWLLLIVIEEGLIC